jgi:hypothetical protein
VQLIHGALARHGTRGYVWQDARDIRPSQDGYDTGQASGSGRIDRADAGMRIWTPQHGGMEHIWELDIIYERAATRDEFGVFKPFHRLTDVVHLVPPCP